MTLVVVPGADVGHGEHGRVERADPPRHHRLQRADHRGRGGHRIERVVRRRGVPTPPGDRHVEVVGRRHDRVGARLERARREARRDVQGHRRLGRPARPVGREQPLGDHHARAVGALLAGLEHEDDGAGEAVAPSGEQPGGGRQHRGVQVVPAGVHGAVDLGGERQPGVLVHRQRVHVRAHEHRRSRPRAAQDGDDRAALPAGVDLERQVLERGEHGGLGDGQRQADLGVPVQGAPQLQRPWLQGAGLGQQRALRGTVRRAAPARSPLRSAHPSDPGTPTVKSPHPGSPTGVPPDGRRPCADDRPALP